MAEDLLPLVGHNMQGGNEDSRDSESSDEEGEHEEQMEEDEDVGAEEELEAEAAAAARQLQEDIGPAAEAAPDEESRRKRKSRFPWIRKRKEKDVVPEVTYDKSLPGAHAYLGTDLEEVRGRTIHEDESYQDIPLLELPGVVLAPGQTLPLNLFQPSTISMIRNVLEKDKTFGLVTSRYLGHDFSSTLASIGTTAEILAIKEDTDDMAGITTMRVKAVGRQRFEIKKTRRQVDGTPIAKVRILPERILPDPLEGAHLQSCRRVFACEHEVIKPTAPADHRAVLQQFFALNKPKKMTHLSSAVYTWWPPWVYKQYDMHFIMGQVQAELRSWNESLKDENVPKDPTEFSYWLAGNLPLDDGMKLHLLQIDSTVQRLRCELAIMQKCSVLCCKRCGVLIANKKDVFCMATEGLLAAYVNPGGYVHETLTLYKAQGVSLVGSASTENSWFPGYAWTIAQCMHCHSHMGWKFTAVKRKMKPEKFWGLCRPSLRPGLQKEGDENSEAWIPVL